MIDEMEYLERFSYLLNVAMKEEGMNATELARQSHCSKAAIHNYLNAKRMPTLKAVVNMSLALNRDIYDIVPVATSIIVD